MMKKRLGFLVYGSVFLMTFFMLSAPALGCTSVIISGRVRADGKPLMMKHRDTGTLDNRMEWFRGAEYTFVGLVNSPSSGGEIWAGTNSAGFSIMNTATYDLKDDDVPSGKMDREGTLMYRALEICEDLQDFEFFLDTLSRPMGVEANFGVIDAKGGAAYYETNNHSWTKFDVNAIDCGYRVVTNFTATGRVDDRKGVDRFVKASGIMSEAPRSPEGNLEVDAMWLMDHVSRSGAPIMRKITSATIVFEGVEKGENPMQSILWTALGYPETTVTVPLMVLDEDRLPAYVKGEGKERHASLCDNALKFKGSDMKKEVETVEKFIVPHFYEIYGKWVSGRIGTAKFVKDYERFLQNVYQVYQKDFLKEAK